MNYGTSAIRGGLCLSLVLLFAGGPVRAGAKSAVPFARVLNIHGRQDAAGVFVATGFDPPPPPPAWTLNLSVAPPEGGSVTPDAGIYLDGTELTLTATPTNNYEFTGWSGDISGTNNPCTIVIMSDLTVTANFSAGAATNHPTPLWWLTQYGYSDDSEATVCQLGANGYALWQSYIAGLDPTNPASILTVGAELSNGLYMVTWQPVTGRVYSVLATTNLDEAFQALPDSRQLPSDRQAYTSAVPGFFRLAVELP